MTLDDLFLRFALALGIGLLIGLERGWKLREEPSGARAAGIRTFGLSGLLGGVFGALAVLLGGATSPAGGLLLGLGFAAHAAVFALFCRDENIAERQVSATTAVAGMVTFALGAYALLGDRIVAAAAGVAATVLLAGRERLHGWVEHLAWHELRSGLLLLAMTFVALPLVPDRPIAALAGVNLHEVWIVAIVLAGVSFVGYAAVKAFGARLGVLMAAAAGGLVSSTAVTVTNARRAAQGEGAARVLAGGAVLATAVSLVRTLAIVAALNPVLLTVTAAPLLAAAATSVVAAVALSYLAGADDGAEQKTELRNPFELSSVLSFALLLGGGGGVGGGVGSERYGAAGVLVTALVTGLADVDAITVSIAQLAPQPLGAEAAGLAILAAVASNTVAKLAIGVATGGVAFAVAVAAGTFAAFLAAGAGFWLAAALGS
ncbi:MAG: DUF4010 domain-containing protein [Xanthobacteraceae bacterium]|nr:DUF4010 domain-containing protein [Xanthobacteraceae bacterium]